MYEQLPQYLRDLLEEMKRHLKPGRRGRMVPPSPDEDVEFWRMVDLFIESARKEGINISMKSLAEMLGVGYQSLVNRYRMWEEIKKSAGDQVQQPEPVGEGEATIIPPQAPQPAAPQPAQQQQGQAGEVIELHPTVQSAMIKAALNVMKKQGEKITSEVAEDLIKLGIHIYDNYADWCFKHDFKNLMECVDYIFNTFDKIEQENTELKVKLEQLEQKYEHLKRFAQRLFAKTIGRPDPERVVGVVGSYIDEIMESCLDPDTAYAIAYRLLELLDRLLNAFYTAEQKAAV